MNTLLRSIIDDGATIVSLTINKLYRQIWMLVGVLSVLLLIEWGFNSAGAPAFNYIFFFGGSFIIAFFGFRPIKGEGVGAVIGFAFAILKDKDLTQGIAEGITGWMKVVTAVLFSWFVLSGLLSTWSFEENPLAFLPIIAGVLIFATMLVVWDQKGSALRWIVTAYTAVVIILAFYSTINPDVYLELRAAVYCDPKCQEQEEARMAAEARRQAGAQSSVMPVQCSNGVLSCQQHIEGGRWYDIDQMGMFMPGMERLGWSASGCADVEINDVPRMLCDEGSSPDFPSEATSAEGQRYDTTEKIRTFRVRSLMTSGTTLRVWYN